MALLLPGSHLAAQLGPPSTGGIVALDRLLQRASEQRRLLMIGAHPDDEDTALLALMARGHGAETAYLSLSRGEGGQNLLGPELGIALGLLRSRELEAARAVDGAQQFFTRGYDFGYTRSLEETERFWTPDSILKDVVRVVRRFRPQVMVAVFSGTTRDGHGQHQMSAVLARRAFEIAGDPRAYPELAAEEGLAPWAPLKLYRSTRFDSTATTLALETGGLDPRDGRSYQQIAMASRSEHRSQDFGVLQPIGPARARLALLERRDTSAGPEHDLFDGIPADTSWIASFADSLRRGLSPARLADAVLPLAGALRRARREQANDERTRLLERALAIAAGLEMDATAPRAAILPGEPLDVTLTVYDGGPFGVAFQGGSAIGDKTREGAPAGSVEPLAEAAGGGVLLAPGEQISRSVSIAIDSTADPSQPYFLRHPLRGSLYDWSGAPPATRGLPFGPPVLEARATVSLVGVPVVLSREVTYRYADQAVGEIRQPLTIVPLIELKVDPDELVWSSSGARTRPVDVTLTYHGVDSLEGAVALEVDGWPAPAAQPFRFARRGETRTFRFTLERPSRVRRAAVTGHAVARTRDGRAFGVGVESITYPHVRPTSWVQPAQTAIRVAPILLPPVGAVGYVRGASDRVPEALAGIGLPVELLDADALARGDLSRFDAIVVGSRAYETDSALVRHNDRLLAYVRGGGLLLVQYQQYQFVRGGFAPYSLTIASPHDRITDETAPVRLLQPHHPAFRRPNRIDSDDWQGWPQERGLYYAHTWDDAYTPLLEMADPGGPPLRGGLLVARYGAGTYVYTGISFFRALPAGVPGAYRLFLNLVALGATDGE